MKLVPTNIPEVMVLEPKVIGDRRGFFMETWREEVFEAAGIRARFVQDNHSRSRQGALRGLHYQLHRPQGKLVRVVAGTVWDAAVDLRRSSPTFGQWTGQWLSAENKLSMWIPPGFAHGFYVAGESADVIYSCTDYYAPQYDRVVRWDDPDLGIAWPLDGAAPVLSDKDARAPALADAECYD